jgi:regulator of replication initiation timing
MANSTDSMQGDLFDDIFKKLEEIRKRLPNGELNSIKNSVNEIMEEQKVIREKVSDLSKRLLDPDNGVVVKVNKNTELIEDHITEDEDINKLLPKILNRIDNIEKWQGGINKALWIVFGSIAGLAITMFIQYLSKQSINPEAVQTVVQHVIEASSVK